MTDSGEDDDGSFNIFKEPEGYLPPEKQPTAVSHTTLSGQVLTLRLIGHSPLWVGLLLIHLISFSYADRARELVSRHQLALR